MADTCANLCGKAGHLACRGCLKAPPYLADIAPTTFYCGAECQKSHWAQHKGRCKILQNRKIIHRAAKVIQDVYNIVIRKSYRHTVEKVDRVDEHTIFVHVTNEDLNGKNTRVTDYPPGALSSSALEELAVLTSDGPVVQTNNRSADPLFSGLPSHLMESQIIAMNRKLWVLTILPDGEHQYKAEAVNKVDQHEVFCIMLLNEGVSMEDQERYALDLTNAQYGHEGETLMEWRTYVETRVRSNKGLRPIGWTREESRKLMTKELGRDGAAIHDFIEQFRMATTAVIREFPGWIKLWKESDETIYQNHVDQLMRNVVTRLDKLNEAKANHVGWKLWHSTSQKMLMMANAKRIRKQKLDRWGHDNRGPAFVSLVKLVKARQAKERKNWGTPEDEKKRVQMTKVHAGLGTDYKDLKNI
ncbi:MAG: hypothetical protein Q9170_002724 [Blastenia crenularia]